MIDAAKRLVVSVVIAVAIERQSFARIEKEIAASLRPPTRLSVTEWSRQYRILSKGSSAQSGKFEPFPYQIEPMDCVTDPSIGSVSLQWASQLGKSEMLNNIIGYFIHADPSPILMLQPTIEVAERYSKKRIAPMIRDTPVLREIVSDPRSRDSGNTILEKTFPGGGLTIVGANAPAGLASTPIRVVVADEVDRYPASAGSEGDPLSLASRRTETFFDAIEFKTSTPTIKGLSRIEAEMAETDYRKWFVRCKCCNHQHTLEWSQVRWPEGEPEKARLHCPKCDYGHTDEERRQIVWAGQWIATQPGKKRRGYFLNGIANLTRHKRSYASRLHQMVAEYLSAKSKGPEAYQVWWNTFLALTWEDEGEKPMEVSALLGRRETYSIDPLPEGVLVITAGVDKQVDRFEVEIVGHGENGEAWGLRYDVIMGDTSKPDTWKALEDHLTSQTFKHPCGAELSVTAAMVDASHDQEIVLNWAQRHAGRRWWALKGARRYGHPVIFTAKSKKGRGLLHIVRVWVLRESLFSRLKVATPGPGYQHFPLNEQYGQKYFEQLTNEKKQLTVTGGMPSVKFIQLGPNEALDCRIYSMAALERLNPAWPSLKRHLQKMAAKKKEEAAKVEAETPANEPSETVTAEPQEAPPPEQTRKPRQRPRNGRNWVSRW